MHANSSSHKPLFSIILPTCNRADMVRRSVSSVRQQLLDDFELIVVDDGSAEPYCSALSDLKDKRIKVIRNNSNQGVAQARNAGIEAAKGKFLTFIDDDDEWLGTFLGGTYDRLKDTPPDIGISWCGVICIDYPKDSSSEVCVRVREFATDYPSDSALFKELLSIGTGFGLTFKASCLKEIGPFNPRLKVVEDADIFLRTLGAGFSPVVVPGVHVVLHNHNQQRLTGLANHPVRIRECEWLLSQYSNLLGKYPALREQLVIQIEQLKSGHPTMWSAG